VKVTTDCGMSPVKFVVCGPIGAFGEAEAIAKLLLVESSMKKKI
jgi:hypothetical protein